MLFSTALILYVFDESNHFSFALALSNYHTRGEFDIAINLAVNMIIYNLFERFQSVSGSNRLKIFDLLIFIDTYPTIYNLWITKL